MRKIITKLIILALTVLFTFILYNIIINVINSYRPKISISRHIKNEADYIIAVKEYAFFPVVLDKIIAQRKLRYRLYKKPIIETLKLLENVNYISESEPCEYLLAGDMRKFYFVIKYSGNYVKKRLALFIDETHKIPAKEYTVALIREKGLIIREISHIKTYPRPKYGGLTPPPRTLHKIYAYVHYNVIYVSTDLNHLIETLKAKPVKNVNVDFGKTGLWVKVKK